MTDTTEAPRDRLQRLRNARDKVAQAREAREAELQRRAELPASVCRVCGASIAAGQGDRAPEPPFVGIRERDERLGMLRDLPAVVDGWRRRCEACAAAGRRGEVEAEAISGIVGRPVSQADACDVVAALRRWTLRDPVTGRPDGVELQVPLAEITGRYGREPWEHVTTEERERVADVLQQVIAARNPARCSDGPCGLCGRSQAVRWFESAMRWADGSAAPVCGDCEPTYASRSEPRDRDGDALARVAIEILTGWAVPLGIHAPEGVKAFCESQNADREGTPEPWQYAAERIADLRFSIWRAQPELAPDDMREAAEGWRRDYLAERAADAEAEAQTAAAHVASW
jgi:hypothetical protein